MKRRIITLPAFICTVLILLIALDEFFSYKMPHATAIKNYWLLSKTNESFDIAFMGNSRVLNTLDLSVFKEKNLQPINLALSGVGYAEQYLMLKLFLEERKNHIGKLFIEISNYNLINPDSAFSYPFHEYYYFPYIKQNDVFEVIQDNSKHKLKTKAWRLVPFIKYAEFNSNLLPLLFPQSKFFKSQADQGFDEYGSILISNQDYEQKKEDTSKISCNVNSKTVFYLKKMIQLAQNNKIEVGLFTCPVHKANRSCRDIDEAIEEIRSDYDLKYLNFESHAISAEQTNFKDKSHLNREGAVIFSRLLRDSLSSIN